MVVQEVLVDVREGQAAGQQFRDPFDRIDVDVAKLVARQGTGAMRVDGSAALHHQAVAVGGFRQRGDAVELGVPVARCARHRQQFV
ncbi:hypothetical protein D9M68_921460 [compost metagenome]